MHFKYCLYLPNKEDPAYLYRLGNDFAVLKVTGRTTTQFKITSLLVMLLNYRVRKDYA